METNLKFNSQICTTKIQSELLLALGLKKETADIVIRPDNTLIVINENSFIYHNLEKATQEGYFPAWSLHRLLCILPTEYSSDIDFQQIMRDFVFGSKDMYDEVIHCIETLIEAGYFYDEYLEE
jgi:hypothetical protein